MRAPLPALATALVTLLAHAGCVQPAAPDEAVDGASLQSGAETPAACVPTEEVLLDWRVTAGASGDADDSFELGPGARLLRIEWTEPTAMAGDVEIRLTAPDESVLFERVVGIGVMAGGSSVTVGGTSSNGGDKEIPDPLLGVYTFTVSISGEAPGAALKVTGDVCDA